MVDLITKYNAVRFLMINKTERLDGYSHVDNSIVCRCGKSIREIQDFNSGGCRSTCRMYADTLTPPIPLPYPLKVTNRYDESEYYCNQTKCNEYVKKLSLDKQIRDLENDIINLPVKDIAITYKDTFRELVEEFCLMPGMPLAKVAEHDFKIASGKLNFNS
jgi:hypothetical protein